MTDSKFKSKRKITAATANAKPKYIATATTCIGKVEVTQYSPNKKGHRLAVTLTTNKGDKRAYYLNHMQKKPVDLSKRLKLTNKNRKLSLIQTTDDEFILKHDGLPNCHIEVVDYGVKVPLTKYNGLGLIIASILAANADRWEPVIFAQEEEEEDWFGGFDFWIDEVNEIAEVIGGNNNPWESGGTGNDGDDEDDNDNNGNSNDGDDGGGSWWDWLWGTDGDFPK